MLFLDGLGLAISGFVRWFILPGGGRGGVRQEEAVFIFARHTWTDIHQRLAVIFLVLVVVHVCLHWNWLLTMTKKIFGRER
ncbi:MAG: DUF4405 domain-containing protein [Bacillota bacterium]